MGLYWYIASRLGSVPPKDSSQKLGRVGNVIAILSVTISILIIILSIAISSGFRKELKHKAVGLSSDLTIMPPALTGENKIDEGNYYIETISYKDKIEQLSFVDKIQGVSYRPCMIKTSEEIQGVIIKGVSSDYDFSFLQEYIIEGEIIDSSNDSNQLLISEAISNKLSLSVGEDVFLYFVLNEGLKVRKFTVCGIYSVQFEKYDNNYVITSKDVVNDINGWQKEWVSNYEILYKDHSDSKIEERKEKVAQTIYSNFTAEDQIVSLYSISDSMSSLFDWLNLLDLNVLILLILMILVAGFNMVSAILIILFENISTIGVFKSLGLKDIGVKRIFIAKSCKIVLYGLLIGNVMAIAFCLIQKNFHLIKLDPQSYFIRYVPINIDLTSILLANLLSFIAIMLIMLIPCHFISRISPAKSLQIK